MDSNQTTPVSILWIFSPAWQRIVTYHGYMAIILTVISILGNTITLVAMVKNRRLRRKENALIVSLAVSDLLVGILTFLNNILIGTNVLKHGWTALAMSSMIAIIVSLVHMVVIGLNRFIAVVLPLRYSTLVTKRTIIIMVAMTWAIPTVVMVPVHVHAIGRGRMPNGILFVDWAIALNDTIWILLLCLALVILYGKILLETRAQAMKVQAWKQNPSASSTTNQSETRAAKTKTDKKSDRSKKSTRLVLIILSIAMILNTPFWIYSILILTGSGYGSMALTTLNLMSQQCYLANSGVNIFIYALFTSDFRRAYERMFCFCRKDRNLVEDISMRDDTNETNVTN